MALDIYKIAKGVFLKGQASAPSSPSDGTIYYDNTSGFQFRQSGSWNALGGGSAITWTVVTGTSQAVATGNGYIANNASKVDFTLPATASVGSTFYIVGMGNGGWKLSTGSGQTIYRDTITVSGTGSYLDSSASRSCVQVVCIVANTDFEVINSQGATSAVVPSFPGLTASYFVGGHDLTNPSNAFYKLLYSGETASTLGITLTTARNMNFGVVSTTKGFTGGGANVSASAGTNYNSVESMVFSGETYASVAATLPATRRALASGSNVTSKGYGIGGDNAGTLTAIVALTYSGESIADLSAVLSTSQGDGAGMSSSSKCYVVAGTATGSNLGDGVGTAIRTIQSLVFSGETYASVSAQIGASGADARNCFGSTASCSTSAGYLTGGFDDTNNQDEIFKLTFSGETTSTPSIVLASTKRGVTGSSSTTKGYQHGGRATFTVNTIEAITFSGDSIATISATMGASLYQGAGLQI